MPCHVTLCLNVEVVTVVIADKSVTLVMLYLVLFIIILVVLMICVMVTLMVLTLVVVILVVIMILAVVDTDGHVVHSGCGSCDSCCGCDWSCVVEDDSGVCSCCGDVENELFSGECVLSVDENEGENGDLVLDESKKQIHQMQMEDVDLQPYLKYHCHGLLPEDQKVAQKIVLVSQQYELIDGVLHHENPNRPGQWCVVVPTKLRFQATH